MENPIIISNLNDFIFCPASIYFHNIYGQQDRRLYQSEKQLNGTKVHETVDEAKNNKNVLHAMDVYCGVLHTMFYMKKSLACDVMEPLRAIVDEQVKKSLNLGTVQDLISTVVDCVLLRVRKQFINPI